MALGVILLVCLSLARSQLVLDDVAEDDELLEQRPPKQPTDPMTKLLQWGVDNTDPNALAERAKAVREGRAEPLKLDKEVMDAMFGTKVKYLQTCVKWIHQAVASGDEEKIIDALHELEGEVTDIDNANDLDHATVGGLEPVLQLLTHASPTIRAAALWVIGTTVQSNPKAQELMISKKAQGHDVLQLILLPIREATGSSKMTGSDPKLLSKALYALGTLLRGSPASQQAFVGANGPQDLTAFVAAVASVPDLDAHGSSPWLPVKRKVVALIGDLVVEDVETPEALSAVRAIKEAFSAIALQSAAGSILAMIGGNDRELQEKALVTLLALLKGDVTALSASQILEGPSASAKIRRTIEVARKHLAMPSSSDDDDTSWEEVALLGEQLKELLKNVTGTRAAAA